MAMMMMWLGIEMIAAAFLMSLLLYLGLKRNADTLPPGWPLSMACSVFAFLVLNYVLASHFHSPRRSTPLWLFRMILIEMPLPLVALGVHLVAYIRWLRRIVAMDVESNANSEVVDDVWPPPPKSGKPRPRRRVDGNDDGVVGNRNDCGGI